ncbi:hypothetical protein QJS04_geneDACA004211 [Acorus gramineus]|uniref:Uncharacterized protein n=1 Tax=Acorus gramineus TaxID=55184 RepID=A0AAV9B498_ACOGR|nr:hypothetical protein QJS04_geneDACA004211 [Acorus gramineus]
MSESQQDHPTSKRRLAVIADLNDDPPESAEEEPPPPLPPLPVPSRISKNGGNTGDDDAVIAEGEGKSGGKPEKGHGKAIKGECVLESGMDADAEHPGHGATSSREEKVCSLKAALVHVVRKMPKNAHVHFYLGLMYQRLGQPQKAVLAFEKSTEILQRREEDVGRPDFLSLVQLHHAQCLLLATTGNSSGKELELEELDGIHKKLKESVQVDVRNAAVWNTLGAILLRTGRLKSAISVLSALLDVAPDNLDSLANLGIAFLQSGNMELSAKCFQDLVLKDQNHPAALVNYATFLLCKYGSNIAGAGANADEVACMPQTEAANVAKECLIAAARTDPMAGYIWVNLASAYSVVGDHRNAKKCLEKAAKAEPNHMSTRYAIVLHRVKDAERSQDPAKLSWAANEMESIVREGDPTMIDLSLAWAGMAMVHRAQHEIAASFETGQKDLMEAEERAIYTLNQATEEDPDDVVPWNQLGLYKLCTLQFKASQTYLKAAVARCKDCSYAWSNLGISLQLSEDPSRAEEVYRRALSLAGPQQAHAILSNLGNLYRQQKRFSAAKTMFEKSLELCPGYSPAHNNLGLVYVAEGHWEEAKSCFNKALHSDPLLDAAKSNMMKAVAMFRLCAAMEKPLLE